RLPRSHEHRQEHQLGPVRPLPPIRDAITLNLPWAEVERLFARPALPKRVLSESKGSRAMSDPVVISDPQGRERIKVGEIVETASPATKGGKPTPTPAVVADWWGMRVKNASGVDVIEIGRAGGGVPSVVPHPQVQPPSSTIAFGGGGFDGHLE